MKNIRLVIIGELILFIVAFMFIVLCGGWEMSAIWWFVDFPSLLLMAFIFVPRLLIMREWKNFLKAINQKLYY